MARLDANQIAEKHKRRMQSSGPDYEFGVNNPSRAWDEGALAAVQRTKAELINAINDGRIERGIRSAGNERWQQGVREVGASRFTQSAERASRRYAQTASDIVAASEAARDAARSIPNTTMEERIQRSAAAMRATSAYWKRRR